ncbi:alpha/beta fold hydrolase [Marinobacter sp. C2H3]|uniref:alpha/beta fold hydrolase n=1 Tax=Marinobacter sp. C2H3 TaxID=3119003 RepID=UPI00300EFC85
MDWLLLRGLTRESAHWGAFPERLKAALPEHRFWPVDLPGAGDRYRDPSPDTIPGIRRAVAEATRALPRPLGLLALSLGGMVALDWAQAEPEVIARVVLINSSSRLSPPWQRLRPGRWPAVLRLLAAPVDERERGILAMSSNHRPLPAGTLAAWQEIQRQRPVSRPNALRQLGAALRYRPSTTRPLADALVLASRADRLVDWRCSWALANRYDWPLMLHDRAGHDLPLDDPDWTVERIRRWLAAPEVA